MVSSKYYRGWDDCVSDCSYRELTSKSLISKSWCRNTDSWKRGACNGNEDPLDFLLLEMSSLYDGLANPGLGGGTRDTGDNRMMQPQKVVYQKVVFRIAFLPREIAAPFDSQHVFFLKKTVSELACC